ncbi:thioredoxin family protein [Myroides sp. JBRI-B21084]|uniref:thioredoxin family protein n=1 Tax=Myroides sp. JBRI-B21084 TaxID=3119977 RepID=UPI0026E27BF3|nr:thioredoxin family protein [Paenimyroides cloacae]WKW45687.1 thioredoxin family protein [Paenimyroides cloacae]
MKKLGFAFILSILLVSTNLMFAQTKIATEHKTLEKPYNPEENAQQKIDLLLKKAKKQNKFIILQAGGNWCSWCLLFNDFIKTNKLVKNELNKNFLYYHLNYSKENKNEIVFAKYAPNGSKLGYPFFIVLDKQGKVVKLQESGSLEQGKGYNENKVLAFLKSIK